ncbi:MAG TPA: NAD(P)H-quinone oxidoreductase [Rhizomicrobium sp.]|nr:NAD(P)H-quinone oxidoreductase [Rhizomicrobium sp.]
MRVIHIENPGPNYRLVLAEGVKPPPPPGEVLIKVAAAGVNRADIAQAQGMYPPPSGAPDTLGMEVSGTVCQFGSGVHGLEKGQHVCALLAGGGYAEYALAPAECVMPVPEGVDLIAAAGLPEVYMTVWTNLMDSARLQKGESVLIHGGSSGIGTAAIQLCAALGHKVFTTAGSQEKCDACKALGAHCAINYREEDFVAVTRDVTHDHGVDVILDMVGGDYIERNFRAAAKLGRIVNIAFLKGIKVEVNFGAMMMKRLSFMATTLRGRTNAEKGAIRDTVVREVWPLIAAGRIRPIIDSTFPLAEAQAAHARMASSSHIGKILLTP